jgi:RND family efflux transporter MFP subunit
LLACLSLGCSQSAPPPEEESRPPAPVKVETPKEVTLGEWTELIGSTQPLPDRAARLTAAVEGRIVSVLKDEKGKPLAEGQQVKAEQVIVQLDDSIVQANLDKQQAMLKELEEQKKQAKYAVELADIEVKRLEELNKGSSGAGPLPLVSRVELDKARLLRKDAESKQEAFLGKQATLKAEMKALQAQKAFYTLKAPIGGELGMIQVMPGQTLPAGTAVVDVVDLSDIDVLCYVPPHTAARLKLNQEARIAAKEEPSNKTPSSSKGKITFIAVQALPETGNFAVKVRFPNRELKLRANTVLRVQVLIQPEKKRLTIPEAALLEDQVPPRVIVVQEVKSVKNAEGKEEKVGKARKLRVVTGVRDRNQEKPLVEIISLQEDRDQGQNIDPQGVLFVIEGAHGLQDGDSVRLEEEEHK